MERVAHVLLLFTQLNPSTGRQMLEDLFDIRLPVMDSQTHLTRMDKVEVVLGISPFLLRVVDLELDIRGDPVGLDRGDVNTGDLSGGEFVANVESPDSGTSTNVEDTLRSFNGGGIELAMEEDVLKAGGGSAERAQDSG